MSAPADPRPGFRPEIQALRAVAVALVLAFHLWPDAVPGGYAGVDVFFAISGFLITAHLVDEVARTGTVSLPAFWARRIRRLLPAASVVLVFCFAAMLAIVPPSLWQRTATEVGASAVYLQNWVLAATSVDYLGADGAPTLVQHFWSLSVEEQFYLAWPVLVLGVAALLVRAAVRGGTAVTPARIRAAVATMLAVVLLCSLVFSVVETARSQPSAYFHTGARAWEFAAGGLAAMLPAGIVRRMPPAVRVVAASCGLALIVVAALLFDGATAFPGHLAAVPVGGALLVILAGVAGPLGRAAPVQWLGAVSYPVYLWHWPLVVLTPYLLGVSPHGVASIGILALALLLGWLTKRFVEDRVRRRRPARARGSYLLAAVTAGVLVVSGVATTTTLQSGAAASAQEAVQDFESDPCYGAAALAVGAECSEPFAVPESLDTAFAATDKGSLAMPCSSEGTAIVQCEFGDLDDPAHTVAVVGNSHAGHLMAGLDAYGLEHGWKFVLMRKTGCTGASTADATEQGCREWTRAVLGELAGRADIDAVAFATNNDARRYVGSAGMDDAALAGVEANVAANLAALVSAGKAVVAVGDVPGSPTAAPDCVYLHRASYDPCSTGLPDTSGNVVASAARATAGVSWVDLQPYFCTGDACHLVIGGAVVYLDEHHLTASFSRSLGPFIGERIAEAIAAR